MLMIKKFFWFFFLILPSPQKCSRYKKIKFTLGVFFGRIGRQKMFLDIITSAGKMLSLPKNIFNFFCRNLALSEWQIRFFEVLIRFLWFVEQNLAKKKFSIFQYKRGRVGLRKILGLRKIFEEPMGMSDFPFCLTKAGQHLLVHVARGPRGMSVERFGKAKEGQSLLTQVRRVLKGISVLSLADPRLMCAQMQVRFMLSKSQGRPALAEPSTLLTQGHFCFFCFGLAKAGKPLVARFRWHPRASQFCALAWQRQACRWLTVFDTSQ